jgi:hypothetical protein
MATVTQTTITTKLNLLRPSGLRVAAASFAATRNGCLPSSLDAPSLIEILTNIIRLQ